MTLSPADSRTRLPVEVPAKDHKTIFEMTRLVGEVRDEFNDSDRDRMLMVIHDILLWVSDRAVPNSRITDYFPAAGA